VPEATQAQLSAISESRATRWLLRLALPAAAAVIVFVAPWFLDTYTVNILIRALFVAIVALTVDILWGYTGYLTFGQSAFFGLGVYTLAIVFTEFGFGPGQALLAFAAALAVAAAVAVLVGWLSFYYGSTPLYASVISLVLPIALVQILYSGGSFTGSSSGLVGFETFDLALETWFRIAGFAALAVMFGARIVLTSDAGQLLNALRDNDTRCTYLGIDTPRLRILLLVICAVIAAAAGFGYAGFSAVAAPENASFTFGTQLVVMVALGGRGTLVGALIGALVIEVASAYLSGNLPYVWELIIGVAFIVVIVLLPAGLFGGLAEALRASSQRLSGRGRTAGERPVELITLDRAAAAATDHDAVIEARDVEKHFGSLSVLSGVSFSARRGELVSLVGPNGAGKTTLIRCLADGRERTGGSVRVAGRSIGRLSPNRIVGLGLGRKFQAASVFETLSVAGCLRVARARRIHPAIFTASPVLALPAAARAVIDMSGLAERLDEEARLVSHGLKQALELAMVLALEPDVILLDEPTAGLTKAERQSFAELLTGLVARDRLCVLIVEHDLDFVREISSRIIVLHQGGIALDGTVAEVVESALVQEIYTGRPAGEKAGKTA
jgi:branched-chain amino acid transport system permease protein